MDAIDLQIVKRLLRNCRVTYREIAEDLELSVNAIYKRVQKMMEDGLIKAFTAQPSLIELQSIQVLVCGISNHSNLNEVSMNLGEHDNVYFVGIAGGNYLYIDGFLKNVSELHQHVKFTSDIAKLEPYDSYIKKLPYRISTERLNKLDYEILKSFEKNARRLISDVANEIGISAKTVSRRINRMMEYDLVDFSINFAPQAEGIMVSQFHIHLKKSKDYLDEFERLNMKFSDNILYLQQFSNAPDLILMTALTKSNLEASKLYSELQTEYSEIKHNIIYNGYFFENWREKLYSEMLDKYR